MTIYRPSFLWLAATALVSTALVCTVLVSTVLASPLLSTPAVGVETDPLERLEIVDRAIAHHGGEAYRAVATELDVCSKSGCFHVVTTADGDLFDYTVSGQARGATRVVNSAAGELSVLLDSQPRAVSAEEEQSYRDWAMARIYFCFLPYRLNDPGVYKHDLGLTTWEGRQLHRVKVTFESGSSTDASDEYMYWFDPETGRLEYLAYTYDDNGGGLRFRRAIGHRRIGGILWFDQENLGVEGPELSVDAIDATYVRETLRRISTVRLEEIKVRPSP